MVGAGNIRYSCHFRVPLTTVDMSSPAIGEQAAAFLLDRIEGRVPDGPRTFRAPLQILARGSTRPPQPDPHQLPDSGSSRQLDETADFHGQKFIDCTNIVWQYLSKAQMPAC